MSIHGYEPYKPNLRGESILKAAFNICVQYKAWNAPLTVRQIFYRLVAEFSYGKTEKDYQSLIGYIARSRRARQGFIIDRVTLHDESWEQASELAMENRTLIPFSWIRDEKGQSKEPLMYDDRMEFTDHVRNQAEEMKLQRQDGQAQVLEVWCEAQGMFPLMKEICDPYGIRVSTGGGYDSVTAKHKLSQRVIARANPEEGDPLPTIVLHIGDFDPSGEGMYETLRDDVSQMVYDMGYGNEFLEVKRVALTEEQVIEMNVETAPPKKTDTRHKGFVERHPEAVRHYGSEDITAQLEALTPPELRALIEEQVVSYIDDEVFQEVIKREEDLREELTEALSFEEE